MAPDVVATAEPAMVMTNRSAYSFAELSLKLAVGGAMKHLLVTFSDSSLSFCANMWKETVFFHP